METPSIEFDKTLRSKKFVGLLIATLLVTYAIPFALGCSSCSPSERCGT
ncbi:hypothetical protein [Thermococcus sp. JdF3]|nr:hypothetical protein [Thermococcus sp. JdF3]